MNIVILSGGSGNDALVKGIKSFYKDAKIDVVINAYDSGKSTGICRKVTNTLGVSDIRKNHVRMYKACNPNYDKRIVEFMEARYDFTKGNEYKEICTKLDDWGLSQFKEYAKGFFCNKLTKLFDFKDFNVANIIYSQMFVKLGYEKTNKIMCDLMGLEDFVTLNSFDNVYINAVTKSGNILTDEGDIVEYKNPNDPITELKYIRESEEFGLNPKAIQKISEANLLIVSTGTFWSSIYPTLFYKDLYQFINELDCKKLWIMNNEEDKDSYGVGSNDFIRIMNDKGLNLNDFTIIENSDACASMRQPNSEFNVIYRSMGNDNGKHEQSKFVIEVLKAYYGIDDFSEYDNIIFDFDDTIWARNKADQDISINNIKKINDINKGNICIISGNTFESMKPKLYTVFGTDLKDLNIDIWADANSTLYRKGKSKDLIKEMSIEEYAPAIIKLLNKYNLPSAEYGEDVVNIKVKPLADREREILVDFLNYHAFIANGLYDIKAVKAGTTTVDIVALKNNKACVFEHLNIAGKKTLYIGDEIDSGNDEEIAKLCTHKIQTSGVKETNIILKIFTL